MQDGTKDTPTNLKVIKLFEKQIEKLERDKVNKSEISIEIGFLGKDIEEAKEIAMEARAKAETPHRCLMEKQVGDIWKKLSHWENWRLKIYGAIITFVLTVGFAWAYQFVSLRGSVEKTQETVKQVETSVKKIEASHYQLEKSFEKSKQEQKKLDSEQLRQITDVVRTAIIDSQNGSGSRNR